MINYSLHAFVRGCVYDAGSQGASHIPSVLLIVSLWSDILDIIF